MNDKTISDGQHQETVEMLTDGAFLEELRLQMLKFATNQLRDAVLAEDAVQEAMIGALKNARSFGRRAALKTWVFAILKNKIADIVRKEIKISEFSQPAEGDDGEHSVESLFDARGFWRVEERPASWSQPMESVKKDHFWKIFEICLDDLPENHSRLFMMREFIELESAEICNTLAISTSNLHVILHRARLRLRECLEKRWYLEAEKP